MKRFAWPATAVERPNLMGWRTLQPYAARPREFYNLGGRVKTGHFVDSQNRPFLAGVETA